MTTKEFYTSVLQKGNNILLRGYRNGNPFQEKIPYKPSLYFKNTMPSDAKTIDGSHLKKRTYDSIWDAKEALKNIKNVHGLESFGSTDWVTTFIRDRYPEELKPDTSLVRVWYWDIETRVDGVTLMPNEELTVLSEGEEKTITAIEIFDYPNCPVYCPVKGDFVSLDKASFAARGFPSPHVADREILLVSLYDANNDMMHVFSRKPVLESCQMFEEFKGRLNFEHYESERSMLIDLLKLFKNNRMDFLLGWNSGFDLGFTYNRMKNVLGEQFANQLSPWGYMDIRHKTLESGELAIYYDIPGIASMDYLEMYQKFNPGSKESWKLDYIARLELGESAGKIDMPGEIFKENYDGSGDIEVKPEEGEDFFDFNIRKFFRTELKKKLKSAPENQKIIEAIAKLDIELEKKAFSLFTWYNVTDTYLVKQIDDKQKLVDLVMMIAYGSRINFSATLSSMMTWESEIYNYFVDRGIYQPTYPKRGVKRAFPGAYVKHPKAGKYGWTISVDAAQLYPSCMMQNNISPDTKVGMIEGVSVDSILKGIIPEFDRDKFFLSPNGLLTTKEFDGYIPELVKQKGDQRKEYKRHMLDCEIEAQQIREELKRRGVE